MIDQDIRNAKWRGWYARNRAKRIATQCAYYAKNREALKIKAAVYREKNREARRAADRKRYREKVLAQ